MKLFTETTEVKAQGASKVNSHSSSRDCAADPDRGSQMCQNIKVGLPGTYLFIYLIIWYSDDQRTSAPVGPYTKNVLSCQSYTKFPIQQGDKYLNKIPSLLSNHLNISDVRPI